MIIQVWDLQLLAYGYPVAYEPRIRLGRWANNDLHRLVQALSDEMGQPVQVEVVSHDLIFLGQTSPDVATGWDKSKATAVPVGVRFDAPPHLQPVLASAWRKFFQPLIEVCHA